MRSFSRVVCRHGTHGLRVRPPGATSPACRRGSACAARVPFTWPLALNSMPAPSDVVGDVGRADRLGQRLGVGGARALEGVGGDQDRLERVDVVGVEMTSGCALANAASTACSAACWGRTRVEDGVVGELAQRLAELLLVQAGPRADHAHRRPALLDHLARSRMASLRRQTRISTSALVALAFATSTVRSLAAGS